MKKRYGNELDEPDKTDLMSIVEAASNGVPVEDVLRVHKAEENRKLGLLLDHYGIKPSPSAATELVIALARDFVPAFRPPSRKGPKEKWNPLAGAILCAEVNRLAVPGNTNKGVRWATRRLAKQEPWVSFLRANVSETTSPDSAEALRKKYDDFKDTIQTRDATRIRAECDDLVWARMQRMAGIIGK